MTTKHMTTKPAEFDSITIKIASPQVVRSWSKGEVKKAETINYRTLKPEKGRAFLREDFWPGKGLGVQLRKIQGDKIQRNNLRPLWSNC